MILETRRIPALLLILWTCCPSNILGQDTYVKATVNGKVYKVLHVTPTSPLCKADKILEDENGKQFCVARNPDMSKLTKLIYTDEVYNTQSSTAGSTSGPAISSTTDKTSSKVTGGSTEVTEGPKTTFEPLTPPPGIGPKGEKTIKNNNGEFMRSNYNIEGNGNLVQGHSNKVTGNNNNVSGRQSLVYGDFNKIHGDLFYVSGNNNTVKGYNATVTGDFNMINAIRSTVQGKHNYLMGMHSTVRGEYNYVCSHNVTIFGNNNVAIGHGIKDNGKNNQVEETPYEGRNMCRHGGEFTIENGKVYSLSPNYP